MKAGVVYPQIELGGDTGAVKAFAQRAPRRQRKSARNQFLTGQFPTHPNRESFATLRGIKSGDQGSFRRDQGIPLSSAIWHSLLVTNPIVPTDFQRCREGEKGAARYSKSRKPISSSTPAFVHVKGAPGMRWGLARADEVIE